MRISRSTALPMTVTALLMAMTSVPAVADSVNPVIQQVSNGVVVNNGAPANATVTGNAGSQAMGSTGLNVSAGLVNQQENIVDTQASAASGAGPTSTVFTLLQAPGATAGLSQINDAGGGSATILGNTVLNMLGNGAVNVAGGIGNMQGNSLVFNQKSTSLVQDIPTGANPFSYVPGNPNQAGPYAPITTTGRSYNSDIEGNAANQGTGNVGLNATTGVMNMQGNNMYLSDGQVRQHRSSPSQVNEFVFQQQGTTTTGATTQASPSPVVSQVESGGSYTSNAGGNLGKSAQGNVGVNVSSGIANMQVNDTYLLTDVGGGGNAVVTQTLVQGNVDGFGFQGNTARLFGGDQTNTNISATVTDNALQQGMGIGALNAASGTQNAQANLTMSMRDVTGSNLGAPTFGQNVFQTMDSVTRLNRDGTPTPGASQSGSTLTARVNGNAGSGFSGDLGINAASGMLNQQGNSLMLSIAGDLSGTAPGTARPAQSLGQYIDSNPIAAAANVKNPTTSQNNASNTIVSQNNDTLSAGIGGAAASGTSGVVGVNVTSGAVNQQSNQVMYFAGDLPFGADSTVRQQIGVVGSPTATQSGTTSNDARINGSAFSNSSGVIAANVSSGAMNQQGNVTLLASSNLTDVGPTTSQQLFTVSVNPTTNKPSTGVNNAEIGGTAFAGATGQVTANVAAGIANQQSNQLTVVK